MDGIRMEIEHIGGNKIRCALTEQEIRSLGFDIDEIIGDSETTQEFMRAVLGLVEEQEHIQVDGLSPSGTRIPIPIRTAFPRWSRRS